MSESDLSWTSESDGDEWHDASDSDWESEWRCGVESDSTTDEEDGRKIPEREYYSDASDAMEECWRGEDSGEGSGGEKTSGEKTVTSGRRLTMTGSAETMVFNR